MKHQIKTEIPEGWELRTIKEIAKVVMGQSPPSTLINENGVGVPFLQGNAEFGAFFPQPQKWITKPLKVSTQNSILISVRAPVGELNKSDTTYCIGRGLASIDYYIGSDYGWYQTFFIKRQLNRISQGSTFLAVSKGDIENCLISLPKLPEERFKITEILKNIDLAIEKTEQLINKYKSIKQGLMQDLFRYGIDEKGQIRSEKTHKFKDSPLGRISEDWNVSNIGTSYLKGRIGWQGLTTKEYLEDGQYLLVTGTDFDNGRITWNTCHYVESKRYSQDPNIQLRNGDVLVTKDGTIGKIAYVENIPLPTTLNSGVFVIRPINKEYLPKFLYYVLRSFFFDKFIENLSAGSTIKHLYQKDFVFPLPNPTEQNEIIKVLEAQDQAIEFEEQNLSKLIHLKQGLMQDLLTGKVRVNHLLNLYE